MADTKRDTELGEELADVLFAISVISKRLARKITEKLMTKEEQYENTRTIKTTK